MGSVHVEGVLAAGVVVANNYRVLRPLAAGGFGTVYLGENTTLKQQVVIKALRDGERGAAAEEARMLASLDHPNVVHIYAYDEKHDCMVMQFLAGESLVDYAHRLDVLASVRVVYQVALALKAIHGAGLVHRDIKPENVMLGRERDWVKVIDMGTALRVGRTIPQPAGTPEFCPPEQFDGSIGALPANDIYALGVTLFSLCARRLPFDGAPDELGRAHTSAPVPDLLGISREVHGFLEPRLDFVLEKVSELVEEMMAKDPARRPDARTVANRLGDLESSFSGGATEARIVLPLTDEVTQPGQRTSTMVLPRPAGAPTTREALASVEKSNGKLFVAIGLALVILFAAVTLLNRRVFPDEVEPPPVAEVAVDAGLPEPVDAGVALAVVDQALEPIPAIDAGLAALPKKPRTPVTVSTPSRCDWDDRFRDYARGRADQLRSLTKDKREFSRLEDVFGDAMVERDCRKVNTVLNQMRRSAGIAEED